MIIIFDNHFIISSIIIKQYHNDLSFSQFLIKSLSVFCICTPLVAIICKWSKSSPFNYFNKSTCLFKWLINTVFFSISFYTKGILPWHFSNSLLTGTASSSNSLFTLLNDCDWHLFSMISLFNYTIFLLNCFYFTSSLSIASWRSFLSLIKLDDACYK